MGEITGGFVLGMVVGWLACAHLLKATAGFESRQHCYRTGTAMTDDTRAPLTAQEIDDAKKWLADMVRWGGECLNCGGDSEQAETSLRALGELEALREAEEKRQRIGTHGPGCYGWGYRHYECALGRIDQLATALRVRLAAGHNDTCGALLSSGDGLFACTCGHNALAAAFEEPGEADPDPHGIRAATDMLLHDRDGGGDAA